MAEKDEQAPEQEEVGLYEKLGARTSELIEEGRKTIDEALKKAKEEIERAGEFSNEQLDRAATFVKRDVAGNAERAAGAVKQAMDPQRMSLGVQNTLSRILNGAAEALSEMAEKAEKNLEFKTGEMTGAGTLTCKGCKAEMHLKKAVRIPPCPKCHQTVFRKS